MIIDKNFLLQKIESYANMESRGKPLKTANLMEIIIATDCKTGDYFFILYHNFAPRTSVLFTKLLQISNHSAGSLIGSQTAIRRACTSPGQTTNSPARYFASASASASSRHAASTSNSCATVSSIIRKGAQSNKDVAPCQMLIVI